MNRSEPLHLQKMMWNDFGWAVKLHPERSLLIRQFHDQSTPTEAQKNMLCFGSKIWLTSFFRKRSFFSPMIYQGILSNIQPVDVGLGRGGELGVGRGPGPWKVLNTWKTTLTYKCIWKRRSPTYFSPNVWDVGKKFALAKKTKIAHSPTGYVCSFRFFWLEF